MYGINKYLQKLLPSRELPPGEPSMADPTPGNFKHNLTEPPVGDRVMPLFSLKGKTAIVSGAGAGIGLAIAQGFAEAGANVAIWYNHNKKAIDRAAEVEKTFGVKCASTNKIPPFMFCLCFFFYKERRKRRKRKRNDMIAAIVD
jgi:threonine dehydrogenase-like Zn-dependent dehydrogenase